MGRTPEFQTEKSAAVLKTSSFPQTSSKKEGSQKNISMATKPFSIRAVNAVFANIIKISILSVLFHTITVNLPSGKTLCREKRK